MEHAHRGGGYATRGGLWLPTEINSNKANIFIAYVFTSLRPKMIFNKMDTKSFEQKIYIII